MNDVGPDGERENNESVSNSSSQKLARYTVRASTVEQ